jgi:pimeloyl-ACP methyl ester carboxylesterase
VWECAVLRPVYCSVSCLVSDKCVGAIQPRYFLYKRADRSCTLLFLARPELEKYTLVKMTSHVITTSDGEKMVALRTLPAGVEATKLPMVLLVHGGPWARDRWGWNAQVGRLAAARLRRPAAARASIVCRPSWHWRVYPQIPSSTAGLP